MHSKGVPLINTRIEGHSKYILRFAFVGSTGAIVNLSLLWLLTSFGHLYYILSALIAIEVSIFWNFFLNSKITFDYKFLRASNIVLAIFKYHVACLAGLLANISLLFILTELLGFYYLLSGVMAIFLAFGLNYIISRKFVWSGIESS
jgi:putative flippase GtrA